MWLFLGGAQAAQHWGEDSRLMRHGPMDWTVGTLGTMGNDALDSGDRLADAWDFRERTRSRPWRAVRPRDVCGWPFECLASGWSQ